MSDFRILDDNFCFDPVTAFRPTSEDSAFPADNLAHPFRSKVWRSYGFFRITSSNNRFDFKDVTGGTERNATVPPGEYTPEDLATVLAGQMVIAGGVGTYVVTHSRSTGKWTFDSDQTELVLLASTGTNVANGIWSTIGFPASDYSGDDAHTGSSIALHTVERMVIDLGNPEEIDSFAMIFDPDTGHKFSNTAVVKLQASASNYWYGTPEVDVTLTPDDTYGGITYFFSSAQNYRYWCVKVTDVDNPNLYVEIPKILLCKATQLGQVPDIGWTQSVKDQSKQQENSYGNVYSDIYPNRRTMKFNYDNMAASDIETLFTIADRLGGVIPIGVSLDPTASLFDKDRFFLYGRLKPQQDIKHVFYNFFGTDLVVEEAF